MRVQREKYTCTHLASTNKRALMKLQAFCGAGAGAGAVKKMSTNDTLRALNGQHKYLPTNVERRSGGIRSRAAAAVRMCVCVCVRLRADRIRMSI